MSLSLKKNPRAMELNLMNRGLQFMNLALWIIQGVVCAAFLAAGGFKVFAYARCKEAAAKGSKAPPLSKGLTTFIGIVEIAGALGVILPMAAGIAPGVTQFAPAGLAIVMILAAVFHLRRHEPVVVPVVLLALSAFVVIGRAS
jgi:DoxX-like protein